MKIILKLVARSYNRYNRTLVFYPSNRTTPWNEREFIKSELLPHIKSYLVGACFAGGIISEHASFAGPWLYGLEASRRQGHPAGLGMKCFVRTVAHTHSSPLT